MPLQDHMQLISVDDHLVEPPHVWQSRLPARWLEDAPKIVEEETEDGSPPAHVWYYEGRRYPQIGLNAVAGKRPEEFGTEPLRYSDMLPG
ncbi:MAG TPA: amidohydrolase, partial [Pseudonocardia sp.]